MERCPNCDDEECLLRRIPDQPITSVLRNTTGEHCAIIRFGDEVWKFLKPHRARDAEYLRERIKVGERFSEWFVATEFDESAGILRQPFIDGRSITDSEVVDLLRTIYQAGAPVILDLSPSNVIVTSDGRRHIIDFELDRPATETT